MIFNLTRIVVLRLMPSFLQKNDSLQIQIIWVRAKLFCFVSFDEQLLYHLIRGPRNCGRGTLINATKSEAFIKPSNSFSAKDELKSLIWSRIFDAASLYCAFANNIRFHFCEFLKSSKLHLFWLRGI